ncbi:hypothetical protein D3C78_1765520 [compost metagenome]
MVVDSFKFAAVDGDDRLGEEVEVAAKHYKLPADAANGFAVVFAKVGDGLKSGAKRPGSHINSRLRSISHSSRRLD